MKRISHGLLGTLLVAGLTVGCADRYETEEETADIEYETGAEYGETEPGSTADAGLEGAGATEKVPTATADLELRLGDLEVRISELQEPAEEAGRVEEVEQLEAQREQLASDLDGMGESVGAGPTDQTFTVSLELGTLEQKVAALEAELGVTAPDREDVGS
jgi:hypothetical protein